MPESIVSVILVCGCSIAVIFGALWAMWFDNLLNREENHLFDVYVLSARNNVAQRRRHRELAASSDARSFFVLGKYVSLLQEQLICSLEITASLLLHFTTSNLSIPFGLTIHMNIGILPMKSAEYLDQPTVSWKSLPKSYEN